MMLVFLFKHWMTGGDIQQVWEHCNYLEKTENSLNLNLSLILRKGKEHLPQKIYWKN